jgi:phage baseplate assembly protein W
MVQLITRKEDYKDLDLNFIAHPVTGDVAKKTGVDAIVQSMKNLVLTNFYDRPFRPFIGSNTYRLLFENMDSLTARLVEQTIKQTIENFEPRVEVLAVKAYVENDNNGYNVKIVFRVINTVDPFEVTIFLERIR